MNNVEMLYLAREYRNLKGEIDLAISNCLTHQRWVNGPEVSELENEVARYLGVKHCLGVASGTDALVISLRALALKLKGKDYFDGTDQIITSAFTFSSTGEAILRSGATPVFIDIDPESFNIDISKIQNYISNGGSGSLIGILPVYLYGQSCDIEKITRIAMDYELFVVEDAAQAFGCDYGKKKIGSYGDSGAFSFYPTKNLGCFGNGGMISTDDDKIAELCSILKEHGGKSKYDVSNIGYNSRLDTLQAAVLITKLKSIDLLNNKRKKIAQYYESELRDLDTVILPTIKYSYDSHVFHQFTIMCNNRDELQEYLSRQGITTMVYYPVSLHRMKLFSSDVIIPEELYFTDRATKNVLSIPIAPTLEDHEVEHVVKAIKEFRPA